ncbi:MAG: glycosyltransferase family A protein [Gemmiger sp.]|nr:glycosyltransferase family A protein [Gemmiger sp.]
MKLITFTVPCYNSAAYMEKCVKTLLTAGPDAEIILVDDGSKDDTGAIADRFAAKYPAIVRAIHQENGGHGEGVNQGVRNAEGIYFKVVDSDDWLDEAALAKVMAKLREFAAMEKPVDLLLCNYVYEHVEDNTRKVISYRGILPQDRVFKWSEIGKFPPSQNILMHSVIYRTKILRDCGLELPKHTFYVDNVFVYQPLPQVATLYYMDLDLYRYFIGREDQSVNEKVMVKRVDQQIRVTKRMIDAVDLYALPVNQDKLRAYMLNYLGMMMVISSVFLTMDGTPAAFDKKRELWQYLKNHDEKVYKHCKFSIAGACNLPGPLGHKLCLWGYSAARKIFKFN